MKIFDLFKRIHCAAAVCCQRTCLSASANHLVKWKIRKQSFAREKWLRVCFLVFSCSTLSFDSQIFISEHTSQCNLRFSRSSLSNSLRCSVHSQRDSHGPFLIRYSFIPCGHERVYFTLKNNKEISSTSPLR